jgi:multiple sugar transport system permease protein
VSGKTERFSQSNQRKNALTDAGHDGRQNEKTRIILRRLKHTFTTVSGYSQILMSAAMYLLLIGLSFVFLFPFLYMLVTSVMSNTDLNNPAVQWIPSEIKFENYFIAANLLNLNIYAWNSLQVTVLASIGHVLSCSFIGYGFARFNFPFKKLLFMFVILAFIVPVQTLIVPLYLTFTRFKWLNTYLPLIVPTFFGFGLKGALYVFIFRQFFLTLPKDLENAAKIDGCGFMRTYWQILFPLAQSALVVVLVLSVVWHWNDFYEPAIYVANTVKGFLPPRIRSIVQIVNLPPEQLYERLAALGLPENDDTINNAVIMSGAAIIMAPVLVFFAFAQRKFMQGIERTGITGE